MLSALINKIHDLWFKINIWMASIMSWGWGHWWCFIWPNSKIYIDDTRSRDFRFLFLHWYYLELSNLKLFFFTLILFLSGCKISLEIIWLSSQLISWLLSWFLGILYCRLLCFIILHNRRSSLNPSQAFMRARNLFDHLNHFDLIRNLQHGPDSHHLARHIHLFRVCAHAWELRPGIRARYPCYVLRTLASLLSSVLAWRLS